MTLLSTFPCLCYVYRYKCEFTECKDRDLSVSVAIICCGILRRQCGHCGEGQTPQPKGVMAVTGPDHPAYEVRFKVCVK